eukprot:TRINITY_DN48_c0_g1_i1.p1 TRINITY_DN48_c0_g1~~TRINITY_DN48_c0_g1_i1.p1  ORF type:complete len:543 (-),score=252.05 TRINITY_DN48_c0_g1_i1:1315-2943(-)
MTMYLLYESAAGYALFERLENEEIGEQEQGIQDSVKDLARFGKMIKLKAFAPFPSAEAALENINAVSDSIVSDDLRNFLEMNLPKVSAKKKGGKNAPFVVAVSEEKLGGAISDALNITCEKNKSTAELLRGVRVHFDKFIKGLRDGDLGKSQLGLAHSYSRSKIKFNVNRVDTMITQSISLLDQMDKDINTFAMRIREWYSYHFPELVRITPDNISFARIVKIVGNKSTLTKSDSPQMAAIEEVLQDEDKALQVFQAAQISMGQDISEIDLCNVLLFATRVVSLAEFRAKLFAYLSTKMHNVAPSLSSLIGEVVGARLISQAGSLTKLAKYPASTIQILGAEKALFRALKTKGNTPKYGLIFNSSFIGKAAPKNKGRISRYLANKCAIASRMDAFADEPSDKYGEIMKKQVEDRLSFYENGSACMKNAEAMAMAKELLGDAAGDDDAMDVVEKKSKKKSSSSSSSKKKKRSSKGGDESSSSSSSSSGKKRKRSSSSASAEDSSSSSSSTKKSSSKKKRRSSSAEDGEPKKKSSSKKKKSSKE